MIGCNREGSCESFADQVEYGYAAEDFHEQGGGDNDRKSLANKEVKGAIVMVDWLWYWRCTKGVTETMGRRKTSRSLGIFEDTGC
jgi:hypothetical protein